MDENHLLYSKALDHHTWLVMNG